MMLYLLKFIGGSTLLWVVYHFGLEQEKMHRFKRFYLLCSLGFTLVVPLISLPWFAKESVDAPVLNAALVQGVQFTPQIAQPQASSIPLESILWVIYSVIAAILLLRLLHNLYQAMVMQTKGEKLQHAGVPLVILPEHIPTHSFFSTIYINPKDFAEESATAILAHELAHVRQGHSWDILFVEVLRVLFWFNPVLYAYKRAIQLNHEFLADEAVIQQASIDIPTYQYLLLDKIAQAQQLRLVQQFDYFNTKKRMMMMLKKTQSSNVFWKKALVLPLFLSLLLMLCEEVHAEKELPQGNALPSKSFQKNSPLKVSNRKVSPRLEPGAGVSQELLDVYIALVKKLKKRMEILKGKRNM
jgi:bla regulator protein blaR1